jgi:leucyl-tRNA synthetase
MKTNNTKKSGKVEPATLFGFMKIIKNYNIQIDRKWQKRWRDSNLYKFKKKQIR